LGEVGAEAATVQAKDPERAENERDPVQDDARQMSQAYAVHGNSLTNQSSDISDGYEKPSGQNYHFAFAEILSHLPTAIV
jgi:hypothetical protein